jgi:hypothetical protein
MIRGFLIDEHLPAWWRRALVRRAPEVRIWRGGGVGAPPLRSPDPVLLEWCEAQECVLLTDNRTSMPGHLAEHMRQGRHIPGIFHVEASMNVVRLAEGLQIILGASMEDEFRDQINYFPLL